MPICRPRTLTAAQAERALRRSVEANPANADAVARVIHSEPGRRGGAKRLVLSVGHRWPESGIELAVQFLDDPPATLRRRILSHMNAWSAHAHVRFRETRDLGQVRIARLEAPDDRAGYWSYLGTEILAIEDDAPTMNLQGFTAHTADAELCRVVRHETGHTLGFEHEHLRAAMIARIDRRKAIAWFDREYGWTAEETVAQVLTPLTRASVLGTRESDPKSIMCYEIPAAITKDGRRIVGGRDISRRDAAFAASIYPGPDASAGPPRAVAARGGGVGPGAGRRVPGGGGEHPTAAPDVDTFHLVVLDPFEPDGPGAGKPAHVRLFATYSGARVTAPMRVRAARGEKPTRFPAIIATHERIKRYTGFEAGSLPDDAALIRFGADLFDTLFQGDVQRLYDEARARQQGRRLDLVLTSMVPWIAEKPWEFAYDRTRGSFLATEDIHFVRNVLTGMPSEAIPPRTGPLRILVVAAQPVGAGKLSIEQETRVIRRGFEALIDAGLAEIEVLARATPGAMHERLQDARFNVVHFIGHGVFDEARQEGALLFEDEHGQQLRLGERPLREILCRRGIELVFLNACQSGAGGRADFNKGIAQSLVAHGLPALVANQYSVLDSSATAFAKHFYRALATGQTLADAARESRIA
ncbi:MAG: CHAT domain-containing protein, partial [Xanthomonadales bacterium]|nr:CHAT domain-containing protein [Xanthomonadales bacterium]